MWALRLSSDKNSILKQNLSSNIRTKGKAVLYKTIIASSVLVGSLFTLNQVAEAQTPFSDAVNVVINGEHQQFSTAPYILGETTYIPIRYVTEALGGSVWWNEESHTVGIQNDRTQIAFIVGAPNARVNGVQISMEPAHININRTMVPIRFVSENLGMQVNWDNQSRTVIISTEPHQSYTVANGDSLWKIAQQHGLTVDTLMTVNNLASEVLDPGHALKIPAHDVPPPPARIQPVELLDWWTEARYVFPIGKVAKVTDVVTGRSFMVQRTFGANHADAEPLTAQDTRIMREIWGGSFSWTPRAIIVEVDGRRLAAAMHSMPHDVQKIRNNNYNGHFCIHFANSRRHKDNLVQASMQRQVRIAANSN